MSEIKSLEKLREKIRLDVNNPWSDLKGDLLAMCDKLEREIEEKYMELPEDGDGKPIRVGDHIERGGEQFTICAIAPARVHYWVWDKNGKCSTVDCDPMECSHYKPRTLEDVLREFTDAVFRWDAEEGTVADTDTWSELAKPYAAEIRELLGVDE